MYEKVYDEPMIEGAALPFELPAWIACAPFEEYLGMRIEEAGEGRAVLSMRFMVRHAQGMKNNFLTMILTNACALFQKLKK